MVKILAGGNGEWGVGDGRLEMRNSVGLRGRERGGGGAGGK